MRSIAAMALLVHGAIHLVGFVVPWQLAGVDGFPYRTAVLAALFDVGSVGIRIVGLAWLILAAGFALAALAVWRGEGWAVRLTVVVALGSLVICVLGLPESVTGILVDLAIFAIAAFAVPSETRATRLAIR